MTYLFVFAFAFQGGIYTLAQDEMPFWWRYTTMADCQAAALTVPIPNIVCMEMGFPKAAAAAASAAKK